jgi:mRNA-degrading endonuclease YafQ of YafQ-DinJ toxin-antitoxin module
MAKKLKTTVASAQHGQETQDPPVNFRAGPDWNQQKAVLQKSGIWSRLEKKLAKWLKLKAENPTQLVGNDTPFQKSGRFSDLFHAHLTQDESLVYAYDRRSNTIFLFGIYSHADLGTGRPPNYNKQDTVGARLTSQLANMKQNTA